MIAALIQAFLLGVARGLRQGADGVRATRHPVTAFENAVAAFEPEPEVVEHEHGGGFFDPQIPDGAIELRRITITEFLTTEGKQLSAAVFQGDDFTDVQKLGLLEFAKTVPITDLVIGACTCEEDDDDE